MPRGRELFIWTKEDVELLKEIYPYKTKSEIMGLLPNYCWKTIWSKAYALGLKRLNSYKNGKTLKRVLDFSIIDTEEKAYALGFIIADGCIRERQGNRSPGLSLKLAIADEDHVRLLRDIISPDSNITYTKNPNGLRYAEFYIADEKLSKSLIEKGVLPRKTYDPREPVSVPSHLLHHWIRGFFDGDGCVYIPKRDRHRVTIVLAGYGPSATPNPTLMFIAHKFNEVYSRATKTIQRSKKGVDSLAYTNSAARIFINWIYENATLYMKRKYELSKEFIVADIQALVNQAERILWSAEEDAYLLKHYKLCTLTEISNYLGRPKGGIEYRYYKLTKQDAMKII
jgi:hypothetical protein